MATANQRARNWEDFRELRKLLLPEEKSDSKDQKGQGQGQQQAVRLEPEDISELLPDAIVHRSKQDTQLAQSLTPIVEASFDKAIQGDPQRIVDVIFPIMGPAIRKAIGETLRGMIQSLNAALEHGFSAQGVRWRIEAMRSGKSFGEVALSHSLLFRVEQVFLIHRESGLLLQHMSLPSVIDTSDGDMISGMLTAIQDFVYDSFDKEKSGSLESMEVGELHVWVEQGPKAVLAAVIRGDAPRDLRGVLSETLEAIHLEMRHELTDFAGDDEGFDRTRSVLQNCLKVQREEDEKKSARSMTFVWIALALALIGGGVWAFPQVKKQVGWSVFVDRLNAEPGTMVTETSREGGVFVITGLRDPLATSPDSILASVGIDNPRVDYRWKPYQSLERPFVLQRAKILLDPPESVVLTMDGEGNLVPIGRAPHEWIVEKQPLARAIPGVRNMRTDEINDVELDALATRLREILYFFDVGRTRLVGAERAKIPSAVSIIVAMQALADEIGKPMRMEVVGQADARGSDELNLRLSQQRANEVYRTLVAAGLDEGMFSAVGIGATLAQDETVSSRRITLVVDFSRERAEGVLAQ